MAIRGLAITNLEGLGNIGSFGDELSIEGNSNLTTLQHLGSSFPEDYRINITNIRLQSNPNLVDVEGFRYIQSVQGESS